MAEQFNAAFVAKVVTAMRRQTVWEMDRIALLFHGLVVEATPVDLGQARAGWTFTLNDRSEAVPDKPQRGTVLPAPRSQPNQWAQKIGDRYHIANFVGHIVFLNEGTSRKAPLKFVERSLQTAKKAAGGRRGRRR